MPKFVLAFAAALLAALIVLAGLAIWWRHYQDEQRDKDARAEAAIVLRDCQARAEAGAQIKATSDAAVAHAEDTAALMGSIRDVLAASGSDSPGVAKIREDIDRYVVRVAEFRRVAEQYEPLTVKTCVARANEHPEG